MKITPENYKKIIEDLKNLKDPLTLLVALFFLYQNNQFDISNVKNSTFAENLTGNIETHLEKCLDEGSDSLKTIWDKKFLNNHPKFLIFCKSLMTILDRELGGLASNKWLTSRQRRDKGEYGKYELPEDWNAPTFTLLTRPKHIIKDRIPGESVYPIDRTTKTPTAEYAKVKNFVITDSLPYRGIEIKYEKISDHFINKMVKQVEYEGKLNLAVSSLVHDMGYAPAEIIKTHKDGSQDFRFVEIPNRRMLEKKIVKVLQKALKDDIDLLMFPELTIDHNLQRVIKDWLSFNNDDLKIKLIIAGSYHLQAPAGQWENRTEIYNGFGKCILTQAKIHKFCIQPSESEEELNFKDVVRVSSKGGCEAIDSCSHINIIDTELGRMSFPICLDFIEDKLEFIFKETWTNLFFVPAMSPKGLTKFKEYARSLGESHGSITLVINSCWCTNLENGKANLDKVYYFYAPHKELRSIVPNASHCASHCERCFSENGFCFHKIELSKLFT